MILHLLDGTEDHPVYQEFQVANLGRQHDFLKSAVEAGLKVGKAFLSTHILKALNYQAIVCLHTHAGEFRPCDVDVGKIQPARPWNVQALMDDLVNTVNRNWDAFDPIALAAFVLWRVNVIHPFINGNGRTARAGCYFVLCLKLNAWLPGKRNLPQLIDENHDEYVVALRAADAGDLSQLHIFLNRLVQEQLAEAFTGTADAAAQEDPILLPNVQATDDGPQP